MTIVEDTARKAGGMRGESEANRGVAWRRASRGGSRDLQRFGSEGGEHSRWQGGGGVAESLFSASHRRATPAMELCCGVPTARASPVVPQCRHRHHPRLNNAATSLTCSWSANRSSKGDFIPGVLLRLGNYSRLDQTGVSVQRRNALRTITAAFDPELHSVLELASDAELTELSNILYGQSPLSPLLKSVAPGDGSNRGSIAEAMHEQEYGGRDALMERLESRFMFLAADAKATLSGRRPTYRDVLLRVRSKLNVPCSIKLSTEDMEAEIFLHLLQDYSSQPKKRPQTKRRVPYVDAIERAKGSTFRDNISSAIRLGSEELLTTILKGSSAVTMSTLQRFVTKKLSGKVLVETVRYQLAKDALVKGGQVVAAKLESQVAMLAARQTLAGAAARYMTLRSTMMVLGPLLWGTFLADVVIRSIGTDYARVVRAIYAFAQIRLSRTYGWTHAGTS